MYLYSIVTLCSNLDSICCGASSDEIPKSSLSLLSVPCQNFELESLSEN